MEIEALHNLEEEVFRHRKPDPDRMLDAEFVRVEGGYLMEAKLPSGDFLARLFIGDDGRVEGKLFDLLNDEEYAPLRNGTFRGPYVESVRSAYAEWLFAVAERCSAPRDFAQGQADRILEAIRKRYGATPDFPWKDEPYRRFAVLRHADTGKWFALIASFHRTVLEKEAPEEEIVDAVNLKIRPEDGDALRARPGIFPAYHMNRRHWITVALDGRLSDDDVLELIETSFRLTKGVK